MVDRDKLQIVHDLIARTLRDDTPGDYIETGVWRGGTCIMMRAILKENGVTDRKIYVADSFEGLPRPDKRYPHDRKDHLAKFSELAISEEQVRANFARYGLLDDQVVFLKGYFCDTLPKLTNEHFALIRLDGDMYQSTTDALTNLYPRLSPGGFCIVDDWTLKPCRKAVDDYLAAHGVRPKITEAHANAWWQKEYQ